MKTFFLACAFAVALAACGSTQKYDSEREWQRAECNKVIDPKDRERCLKRVEGR